jgi:hypothetical protein
MKKNYWMVLVCMGASVGISGPGWADYQYELGLDVDDGERNNFSRFMFQDLTVIFDPSLTITPGDVLALNFVNESQTDTDATHLNVSYYFNPVETVGVPYAEAGFLSKQGKVAAQYSHEEDRSRFTAFSAGSVLGTERFSSDLRNIRISADYVASDLPLILGLGLDYQEVKSRNRGFEDSSEERRWSAKVGYYVTDNGAVSFEYGKLRTELIAFVGAITTPGFRQSISRELIQKTLSYRHVFPIFTSQFVTLNLSATEESSNPGGAEQDSHALGFVYYPIPSLSLGYTQRKTEMGFGDDLKADILLARYFINENLAVKVSAENSDFKFSNDASSGQISQSILIREEDDKVSVGLDYRF